MEASDYWRSRSTWTGLTDAEFEATHEARRTLGETFSAEAVQTLDPCHPLRIVGAIPALQAGITRVGEGLRRFTKAGSRLRRALANDLRTVPQFRSRRAELEVALFFAWRGFDVAYQPSQRGATGPDLLVRRPRGSGPAVPVEVKAPRLSEDAIEHQSFVLDCIGEYVESMNSRGLQRYQLRIQRRRPTPGRWSDANHQAVLAYLSTVDAATGLSDTSGVGDDWTIALRQQAAPARSATTWGPELVPNLAHDLHRLQRSIRKAARQVQPGGIAVVHTMLGGLGGLGGLDGLGPPILHDAVCFSEVGNQVAAACLCSSGPSYYDVRLRWFTRPCSTEFNPGEVSA